MPDEDDLFEDIEDSEIGDVDDDDDAVERILALEEEIMRLAAEQLAATGDDGVSSLAAAAEQLAREREELLDGLTREEEERLREERGGDFAPELQ